ncbi:somatomedin-B and thrombospondin type-1 domain-containing protein [Protopterus annectens]|uniref:somatomedin-B and thrombospondin type-1 domain-containing protein n=1 Tax=Protopterus annectens TaxID=7888 RepID=UPI001CFC04E6|nr:somatomedin-B and thrombospondin type-1 domain-containing protein [Protopterus annectens]XP_043923166.1 somatomedin-B and thrombospondin type-1 domain-containing protein [Protopterus annectens]XP_043923167.1 somatomedin-B and thrombospondin type-1 domain-containing protein [Protopterus annectens]
MHLKMFAGRPLTRFSCTHFLVFPLTLLLLLLELIDVANGGCIELGRCCRGRDPTCTSKGWRMDRTYATCFCDDACSLTKDCCYDYLQACPAVPCSVSEWSHWSGCTAQCKPATRVRRRYILQEPQNGGEPCPPLEEKAGCLEYETYQGQPCGQSLVPAFITALEYSKGRKKRALPAVVLSDSEDEGYCVKFRIESLSPYCTREHRPYARWMLYLREGYTVCVACQSPAMNSQSHQCAGDGTDTDGNKFLNWQAVGNPLCKGTWRRVNQTHECSCPSVHSFVFT